jgi:hypothetical protein
MVIKRRIEGVGNEVCVISKMYTWCWWGNLKSHLEDPGRDWKTLLVKGDIKEMWWEDVDTITWHKLGTRHRPP